MASKKPRYLFFGLKKIGFLKVTETVLPLIATWLIVHTTTSRDEVYWSASTTKDAYSRYLLNNRTCDISYNNRYYNQFNFKH